MSDVWLRSVPSDADSDDVRLYQPGADSGKVDYTLLCDAGSYSIIGQDAILSLARNLFCTGGIGAGFEYQYVGKTAVLKVARNLTGEAGAYAYTGQDAELLLARGLLLETGIYAVTGQDAALDYVPGAGVINYTLALDAGAYSYIGNDAVLSYVSGAVEIAAPSGGGIYYTRRKKYKKELDELVARIGEKETPLLDAAKEVVAEAPKELPRLHIARMSDEAKAEAALAARLAKEIEDDDEEVILYLRAA